MFKKYEQFIWWYKNKFYGSGQWLAFRFAVYFFTLLIITIFISAVILVDCFTNILNGLIKAGL